jgi:hypothetical protein
MAKAGWVDYSGAAPILLPGSLLRYWHGFYLSAAPNKEFADPERPEGRFDICDAFDFANPKTDYDRACALGGVPAVQTITVGPGHGLVFGTELDTLTWWPEQRMLVNGWSLPEVARLGRVEWSDELVWRAHESDFVLMKACDHGADPNKEPHFQVRLEPVEYVIQWGQYGWADDDPALILFRFVPRDSADAAEPDGASGSRQ